MDVLDEKRSDRWIHRYCRRCWRFAPASQTASYSEGTDLSLVEAVDANVSNEFSTPVGGLPYATATVVEEALRTGEATARGDYALRLQTEYVVTDPEAHYYRVTTTDHDRTETTGYEYAVEIDEHDAVQERSRFIPETAVQYVEWEDTVLRYDFEERRPVHVTSTTAVAERVATSPDAFVVHIGAERGVVLNDLTSRRRAIVTQAIEDGYTESTPYSEAFGDLLDRRSMNERGVVSLVRYGAVWYVTQVAS